MITEYVHRSGVAMHVIIQNHHCVDVRGMKKIITLIQKKAQLFLCLVCFLVPQGMINKVVYKTILQSMSRSNKTQQLCWF